jgi:hypothetical protein
MGTACGGVDAKMNATNGAVDNAPDIHSDRKVLLDAVAAGW